MLVVSLFAMLGGFLVYGTYARQKPNTTKPGVISVSSLPKNGVFYQFSLSDTLKYCFEDPQEFAKIQIYTEGRLQEASSIEKRCFSPANSYENATVLITGIARESQLEIKK